MKAFEPALAFGYLIILLLGIVSLVWADEGSSSAAEDGGDSCDLYMAPSSTSTGLETVWGLFAGKDYSEDEIIGDGTVGVDILHLRANAIEILDDSEEEDEEKDPSAANEIVTFLEGFLWVPEPAGAKFELVEGTHVAFIPGPGVVSAMNAKMTNAQWHHFSVYRRPGVGELPGVPHPGRGAQSSFYNIAIIAIDDIKEGSEIFMNYGSNYDESEEETELRKSDYEKLDATIEKMIEFYANHTEHLDDEAKMQIYGFLVRDVMKAAVGSSRQELITKLLPAHPDQLQEILDAGGSIAVAETKVFRNLMWLKKEGFCADNIKYGASTIKEAGRGAFATRELKLGSTIAATPLIPIANSSIFEMHPLMKEDIESAGFIRESDEVIGHQLMINYCLGHPDSSMVFLPAGPGVVYINHNTKPNAKLVWSKHPAMKSDWFNLAPEELMEEDVRPLMEVVALETIQAGEEIFLDYGDMWASAWNAHVKDWEQKHEGSIWPTKAIDLNEKYGTAPFPTVSEASEQPFSEDVRLMSFIMIAESTARGTLDDPKVWDTPDEGTVYDAMNLFEVSIVDRVEDEEHLFNYTIRWVNIKEEATIVENVPHRAILFVDQPESSDHFVPNAFRHSIAIPDDIFPEGPWRNLLSDLDDGHDATIEVDD